MDEGTRSKASLPEVSCCEAARFLTVGPLWVVSSDHYRRKYGKWVTKSGSWNLILRGLGSHWQGVWREVTHEDPSFRRISLDAMKTNDWCQGETCMFHFAQETLGSLRVGIVFRSSPTMPFIWLALSVCSVNEVNCWVVIFLLWLPPAVSHIKYL